MTRIFTDDGSAVPVTVLDVANNRVTQIKTPETDGYAAVQVTFGKRRASRVTKPQAGHLAKAGVEAGELLREFPVAADELAEFKVGGVDRRRRRSRSASWSTSPARPRAAASTGVITRHHFSSNRASHGNSRSHNTPGSIGMAQDPGRVFPGKRMAGQLRQRHAHRADADGRSRRRRARPAAGQGLRCPAPTAVTSSSGRRSKTPAKKGA